MIEQNATLAKKIVDQMATFKDYVHEDTEGKKTKYTIASVEVFGGFYGLNGDNKKDAASNLQAHIQSVLDSGDVTLSDTWAEDNLEA